MTRSATIAGILIFALVTGTIRLAGPANQMAVLAALSLPAGILVLYYVVECEDTCGGAIAGGNCRKYFRSRNGGDGR